MGQSVESMTLREKLNEAERLTRELIDHLERGFIPQAKQLTRIVQPQSDGNTVTDHSVRNQSAKVIQSHQFAEGLYTRLSELIVSIDSEFEAVLSGNG